MSSHHYQGTSAPTGEIEHINFLSENIGALFLNDEYSDVVLVVDGAHFHAHKVILAARSDYFRALLFGGMRESSMPEIELKATPLPAFRSLLKYIYTGQMALANQKEDVVLDILGLAHQYGFVELEASVSDYLREILSVRNACQVLDAAKLYQLQHLATVCLGFLDAHAPAVMATEAFMQLSLGALRELLSRDSFYAAESEVFSAVARWAAANPDEEAASALALVRLPLLSVAELLADVRPRGLASPDALLDAIQLRTSCPDSQLPYRGSLVVDENVAAARLGTQVLQGEMRAALLDGDSCNYDMEKGYTRHAINEAGDHGILVKLGKQAIVNHIKMLLWDKDLRSYSYYVEASMDQRDWVRIVDHTGFYCRSWQSLYFPPRVVRFLRIVGTHNTVNKVFHVVSLEVSYALNCPPLVKGLVAPTENVATIACSASVLEGVSRSRNALLNGDTRNYDWDSGYTCHQLGSGAILVQLGQPYMIGSVGLLLWDCDERSYSFYVEVSANQWDWDVVADRTKEACRSWQRIEFSPRPVAFVRITGTHNTANEVFHCVHFECPAQPQSPALPAPSAAATAAATGTAAASQGNPTTVAAATEASTSPQVATPTQSVSP